MTARGLHTTRRPIDLGRRFGDSSRSEDTGMFGFSRSFSRKHSCRNMNETESNKLAAPNPAIAPQFDVKRRWQESGEAGRWTQQRLWNIRHL